MSDDYNFIKDVYDRVVYLTKNQHEKCINNRFIGSVYMDEVLSISCNQVGSHEFSIEITGFVDNKAVVIYCGSIDDFDNKVLYSVWYCNDKTAEYVKKYIEMNIIDIEFNPIMRLFEEKIKNVIEG